MNPNFALDFSIDKSTSTIHIKRNFNAGLDVVWSAWTVAELRDQWWAPGPWKAKTKEHNFVNGGHWLYAMLGPQGEVAWCRFDYDTIHPLISYNGTDSFCDEHGQINDKFPSSFWQNQFSEQGSITSVTITIKNDSMASIEQFIAMGFKEGFTMALENLDRLLAKGV